MFKIQNWFLIVIAVLQVGATITFILNGSPKLAFITFTYAVANAVFCTMKGL